MLFGLLIGLWVGILATSALVLALLIRKDGVSTADDQERDR